ncbi:MAG: hypothetical protein HYX69_12480 [Planctomycetia bacterium]|nr:hypothetical protein [Planctomycetia bacterium]
MNALRTLAVIVWASPASLLGVSIGVVGLATGGGVARHGRVLEFWGGAVRWFLVHHTLSDFGASAMTLGHVVLGVSKEALAVSRKHELVHVAQYERWGPAFIPAYLLCALVLWLRGRRPYWDNPFEREAYRRTR